MKTPASIKLAIKGIVSVITSSITGFYGWALRLGMQYGGQYLYDWAVYELAKYEKGAKRKREQDAAKKIYEAAEADPKSTAEDRAKAYEEYINSGR